LGSSVWNLLLLLLFVGVGRFSGVGFPSVGASLSRATGGVCGFSVGGVGPESFTPRSQSFARKLANS